MLRWMNRSTQATERQSGRDAATSNKLSCSARFSFELIFRCCRGFMEGFLFFHFKQTFEHPQRRAQPFNHEQSLVVEWREVPLCIGQLAPALTGQLAGLPLRPLERE